MQIGMIVQFTGKAFHRYGTNGMMEPMVGRIFLILERQYDLSSGSYDYKGIELRHQDVIPSIPFPLPPLGASVWNEYHGPEAFVVLKRVKLNILPE